MWVDIFPTPREKAEQALYHIPPPIIITQRIPKSYQLRLVIYNVKDCIFMDKSMGLKMTDIYVRGFLRGMEQDRQKTDTHWRSLNGEGMFNWRMVLDFEYIPSEDCIVVKKKTNMFTLAKHAEEVKLPPVVAIQIWDNDLFSADDYVLYPCQVLQLL